MEPISTPPVLQERLGDEATAALVQLLQGTGRLWSEEVLRTSTERFEHRLTEEISKLRVDMSEGFGSLRAELSESQARLRQDVVESRAQLRQELVEGHAEFRQDLADGRSDLIKWSFVFWIGQVVTLASLVAIMLRVMLPQ